MAGRPTRVVNEGGLTMADVMAETSGVKELVVEINGKTGTIVYRDLSFWARNLALSSATEYYADETGSLRTKFHIEVYYEECLKHMIVQAPFPISAMVLRGMSREAGDQLVQIVPHPQDWTVKAETAKKG